MERNNIVFLSISESAQVKAALVLVAAAQHHAPARDSLEKLDREKTARNLLSLADRFSIAAPAPAARV